MIDYGNAIKDLAAADIFTGDMLLKNFGVTRNGRVICYDYDELCLLSECRFRRIPPPASLEDEFSAEPWFYVGEQDVFPEEFRGLPRSRRPLCGMTSSRLTQICWTSGSGKACRRRLAAGEVVDVFPYRRDARLQRNEGRPSALEFGKLGGGLQNSPSIVHRRFAGAAFR